VVLLQVPLDATTRAYVSVLFPTRHVQHKTYMLPYESSVADNVREAMFPLARRVLIQSPRVREVLTMDVVFAFGIMSTVLPVGTSGATSILPLHGESCVMLTLLPFARLADVHELGDAVCVTASGDGGCLSRADVCIGDTMASGGDYPDATRASMSRCLDASYAQEIEAWGGFAGTSVGGGDGHLGANTLGPVCVSQYSTRLVTLEETPLKRYNGVVVLTVAHVPTRGHTPESRLWYGDRPIVLLSRSVYVTQTADTRHELEYLSPLPPQLQAQPLCAADAETPSTSANRSMSSADVAVEGVVPSHPCILDGVRAPHHRRVAFATIVFTSGYPGVVALAESLRAVGSAWATLVLLVPAEDPSVAASLLPLARTYPNVVIMPVPSFPFELSSFMSRYTAGESWVTRRYAAGVLSVDACWCVDARRLAEAACVEAGAVRHHHLLGRRRHPRPQHGSRVLASAAAPHQ
jgi:hypothetical protein